MDSGAEYEILETTAVQAGNTYEITASTATSLSINNLGTFTKESDSVMACNNIPYFRKGGTNLEYSLKIVGFTSASRAAGSGLAGIKAKGKSSKYQHFESTGESDSDGTIKLTAPTANDTQTVEITNVDETVVIPGLTINNSGDYMGTVALVGKEDYNLKITGTISEDQKYNGYLYGNNAKTYDMVLTITNISANKSSTSICTIESEDPKLKLSSDTELKGFTISTLGEGATRALNLSLSYGDITAPYIDTGITITIENPSKEQEWQDYIPLRFFKGLIPITIAAKNPENNKNAALNGFVIYPDGNNQYFSISNNSSKSVYVPTFGSDKSYMLVFSGATAISELNDSTEMYYTVEPSSKTPKTVITDGDRSKLREYITFGGENHSETSAFEVTEGFEAYLREGEIDYYRITADSRNCYSPTGSTLFYSVNFNSMGGSDITTQIVSYGDKVTKPEDPTKDATVSEQYTFEGWYTSTDNGTTLSETPFDFNTAIKRDITLYAKWTTTPITYTVSFNTMGGSTVESQIVSYGQKASKPVVQNSLSINSETLFFAGWYTSIDNGETLADTSFNFETTITSDITLYAKWDYMDYIPLTLEFINAGSITITNPWSSLEYSKNNGKLIKVTENITVEAGDKISFYANGSSNSRKTYMKIDCTSDCYLYGNITSLMIGQEELNEYAFYGLFINNTHINSHEEKILELPTTTLAKYCYSNMFRNCTTLAKAPALPATSLAEYCYEDMFSNCTSLTEAPSLQATKLSSGCYHNMFSGCTSLTKAPTLPATTLASKCYSYMFRDCTSLTNTPSLPATKLSQSCYSGMFCGCISITEAPSLPATTLTSDCYSAMFNGCTSLKKAPILPATMLVYNCYYSMFYGCKKLSEVKCLAQDISKISCTTNWLKDVSSTGTFIKSKDMKDWPTGEDGIPSGWTVIDAD